MMKNLHCHCSIFWPCHKMLNACERRFRFRVARYAVISTVYNTRFHSEHCGHLWCRYSSEMCFVPLWHNNNLTFWCKMQVIAWALYVPYCAQARIYFWSRAHICSCFCQYLLIVCFSVNLKNKKKQTNREICLWLLSVRQNLVLLHTSSNQNKKPKTKQQLGG